jgi:hypothetical protein
MEFVPTEKTSTIRYPSIANLMVDSADRVTAAYPLCNDFQIVKKNSLLNGFFTRVGATEVVMEWTTPNVGPQQYSIEYSTNNGTMVPTNIDGGFYTQENFLDSYVQYLNDSALGYTWAIVAANNGEAFIEFTATTGTSFTLSGSATAAIFGSSPITQNSAVWNQTGAGNVFYIPIIDLRPARYVDIVCNQLTNNQAVKDASTAPIVRDVLVRWYFDYDNQNPTDAYGYPILMGYAPFFLRRLYNPPKQIQWQTNIPVGNLSLQLYNNNGILQAVSPDTNYLMTLQISEN